MVHCYLCSAQTAVLKGAGSTALSGIMTAATNQVILPASPITPNGQITYNAEGSGAGLRLLAQNAVDFVLSDLAVPNVTNFEVEILQLPIFMSTVSIYANAPDLIYGITPMPMRMSVCILAKIFTGQITMWDDPELAALNQWLTYLPRPIHPIVREPGSGTSIIFQQYLSKGCPSVWTQNVTLTPRWAENVTVAYTSDNASALVQSMNYSIAFVDTRGAYMAGYEVLISNNPGRDEANLQYLGATQLSDFRPWLAKVPQPLPAPDGDWAQHNTIYLPGRYVYPMTYVLFAVVAKDWRGEGAVGALGQQFFFNAVTSNQIFAPSFGLRALPLIYQIRAFDGVNMIQYDQGYAYTIIPRIYFEDPSQNPLTRHRHRHSHRHHH